MYFGKIAFDKIPAIGFAMAHYYKNYHARYKSAKKSVEIAYINSGSITIVLGEKTFLASEGSVVVLFRQLPIAVQTVDESFHSHYTVLAEFEDYDFELLFENCLPSNGELVIPFVTPPSPITEHIAKQLCQIARDMETNREANALSAAVKFLSLLCDLSENRHRVSGQTSVAHSRVAALVCTYVSENLEKPITMKELSSFVGKSPNYIGVAFKKEKNLTVAQYVNHQKINKIAEMMQKGIPFPIACDKMSLSDATYGYKLFKQYKGVTPTQFMQIKKIKKSSEHLFP